ncbi:hypothetical protein TrVE_jg837 [Triparma verrucosa]|uniref:Vesicle-fusing ATPase n=1 Tax=Triparma verrucosa TaxID=1606542 RepID=A0A9W7CJG1_9STRA|nr:hypothetical protein TrVE_jg837 [Triparma verrucosa]
MFTRSTYQLLILFTLISNTRPFIPHRLVKKEISSFSTSRLHSTDVSSESPFSELVEALADTITASNERHNSGLDGASTGWSDWVDESTSTHLKSFLTNLTLSPSPTVTWLSSSPTSLTVPVPLPSPLSSRIKATLFKITPNQPVESSTPLPPSSCIFISKLGGKLIHSRILKNGRIAGERIVNNCITSYGGTMDKVEGKGWGIKIMILPLNSERELLEVIYDCPELTIDGSELLSYSSNSTLSSNGTLKSSNFKNITTNVGGLDAQITTILRRLTPYKNLEEKKNLEDLGIKSPKGILLYGPPGCGKTHLARTLSSLLTDNPIKVVNAPELMSRFVGSSERNVRDLFKEAFEDFEMGREGRHVVVIDEIDACFRKRGGIEGDAGGMVRDSTVNQMLGILDGVRELENTLVIGMSNRRELLDDALLRSGRLEVQVEIGLPGGEERQEIIDIVFRNLREKGRIEEEAIPFIYGGRDDGKKERRMWRRRRDMNLRDTTEGWTGADLAALVRSAVSFSLERDTKGLPWIVMKEDCRKAVKEIAKMKI